MPRLNRRRMLARSTAVASGMYWGAATRGQAATPSEKLNIACVGVGGKGWSDLHEVSVGKNIVAICDVDESRLNEAAKAFPGAQKQSDWRRLLEQNEIDAVTVSTPDHMHAPISLAAIEQGKHIYCQKPLCRTVHEVRQITLAANRQNVVTQMGIQHHSAAKFKTTVKLIRDGVIGKVKEAHCWTDRPGPFWRQAFHRPDGSNPVPAGLNWDLWLGVAASRPYLEGIYHPFRWRAFWNFGTGALGDMGCHGMDSVMHALQLAAPTKLSVSSSQRFPETAPAWSTICYDFPSTSYTTEGFHLVWYDGGKRPEPTLFCGNKESAQLANGILFVGEQGTLAVDYYHMPCLLPVDQFRDVSIEPEPEDNHYQQWISACKGTGLACTPFSYAGPLTEMVLLGNVAIRLAMSLQWDSASLTAPNLPAASQLIREDYRQGW